MAGRALAVDLGTGDGAYVLRRARAEPNTFFVGVDAIADNLKDASRKKLPNALFVRATAEALPDELAGLASSVTVLLPWGSLLRAVLEPHVAVLAGIRTLCRDGASLHVVAGEPAEDAILDGYRAAGFAATMQTLTAAEVRALRTTWAGRLAFGRPRTFTQILGVAL